MIVKLFRKPVPASLVAAVLVAMHAAAPAQDPLVVSLPNQIGGLTVGESTYDDAVDRFGRPDDRDRRERLVFATFEDLGLQGVFRREDPETLVTVALSGDFREDVENGIRAGMPAVEARETMAARFGRPFEEDGYARTADRYQSYIGSIVWKLGDAVLAPTIELEYSEGLVTTLRINAYDGLADADLAAFLADVRAGTARAERMKGSLPGTFWQTVEAETEPGLSLTRDLSGRQELIRFDEDGACTFAIVDPSDPSPDEHTVEACTWQIAYDELAIHDARGGLAFSGSFDESGALTGAVWPAAPSSYAWKAENVTGTIGGEVAALLSSPRRRKLPLDYAAEYEPGVMTWPGFLAQGWMQRTPDHYVPGIIRLTGRLDGELTAELGYAIEDDTRKVDTAQTARDELLAVLDAGLEVGYEAGFFDAAEFSLDPRAADNLVEIVCVLTFNGEVLRSNSCLSE